MEEPVFGRMLVKALQREDLRRILCRNLTRMVREELLRLRLEGELPCPHCGSPRMVLRGKAGGKQRLLCKGCGRTFSVRAGTPFYWRQYSEGLLVLGLILLLDSNLSMLTISRLFDCDYKALSKAIKEARRAFVRGFPRVWLKLKEHVKSILQMDDTYVSCSGFKGKEPFREGLNRGVKGHRGRSRWEGRPGDKAALIAAVHHKYTLVLARNGVSHPEVLEAFTEAVGLFEECLEVWTDEFTAYEGLERHRVVNHSVEWVSVDGVHVNGVEALWSVALPWLGKFRGLSREALGWNVLAFSFMRCLSVADAHLTSLAQAISYGGYHDIQFSP